MVKDVSVDLVIIGAGSAGISAFKEASKVTKNIVLIDRGPLGTTCARVGCMPSKALIQVSEEFYSRNHFSDIGIKGADKLKIDMPTVMRHVRKLRDSFTAYTIDYIVSLQDNFIKGIAEFVDINQIKVNQQIISAKKIIIATGASTLIPPEWQDFSNQILTNENIFEQENFQKKLGVIGGGPIGLELGQSLSRLGMDIELFHSKQFVAGLSDPLVNQYVIDSFRKEFPIHLNHKATVKRVKHSLKINSGNYSTIVRQLVAALGQKPNLSVLGLEKLGIKFDDSRIPIYDKSTLQIQNFPIFIAGDVDRFRPILHESSDDGRIAGYNAVRNKPQDFIRRTPMMIVFSHPNIAIVGQSYKSLQDTDFLVGEVSFENQGRARILSQNIGLLRIYADHNGLLLGSEMAAPRGEHLAHLLAHAIQSKLTVFDLLEMPFYHPVLEEGIRTALRDIASKIKNRKDNDLELRTLY